MTCPRCQGNGFISGPVIAVQGERYRFRTIPCPDCTGTGQVEEG